MSLTFVPTPIGNLGDITLRALEVLRNCDLLLAEDTRVARKLLSALQIGGKTIWSYREQNAAAVTATILQRAATENVALVTDAGMPAIADPGRALVAAARAADVGVEVLPGASAFVCAAVLSGFEMPPLAFGGFVPRSHGERERALRGALARDGTTVFFESPQRIVGTLEALSAFASEALIFVGRELTKLHEQQLVGTPSDVLAGLARPVLGEIALVIASQRTAYDGTASAVRPSAAHAEFARTSAAADRRDVDSAIDDALAAGKPISEIAKSLMREGYGERHVLYDRIVRRRKLSQSAAD